MIFSFLDFLLESKSNKIRIFLSPRLSNFIFDISRGSKDDDVIKIAESLLDKESKESDVAFGYIDLTDRNDMLSFIQKNRIHDIYVKTTGSPKEELFDREDSYYTNWQNKARHKNSLVWSSNRTEARVGKVVKKLTGVEFPDKSIEKFVNEFKSFFDFRFGEGGRFELVSGEKIRSCYLSTNYVSLTGQLGSSCMRYRECQKYLDIYVKNPKVCRLLVLRDDPNSDKISGRALVWTTVDGSIYIDRAYTNRDSDLGLISKYAESKGWESKYSYSREVQLDEWEFEYYPYMDSMCVLDSRSGLLKSDEDSWTDGNVLLRQTDGTRRNSDDLVYSEYSGDYIERDEAVYIESHGDWVRIDDAIYLDHYDDYFHPNEEIIYSDYDNTDYLEDDVVESVSLGIYIFKGKCIEIPIYYDVNGITYDNVPKPMTEDFVDVVLFNKESKGKTIPKATILDPITNNRYLDGFVEVGVDGLTYIDANRDYSKESNLITSKAYIRSKIKPSGTEEELLDKISKIELKIENIKTDISLVDKELGKKRWDNTFYKILEIVGDSELTLSFKDYLEGRKKSIKTAGKYHYLPMNKILYLFDLIRDKILKENNILEEWYYHFYLADRH